MLLRIVELQYELNAILGQSNHFWFLQGEMHFWNSLSCHHTDYFPAFLVIQANQHDWVWLNSFQTIHSNLVAQMLLHVVEPQYEFNAILGHFYTFLRMFCTWKSTLFPGVPRSPTPTSGYFNFVKWSQDYLINLTWAWIRVSDPGSGRTE